MSLNGNIFKLALSNFESDKKKREALANSHLSEIYIKIPRIAEIDSELRETMINAIGAALKKSTDPVAAVNDIRDINLALQNERETLLRKNGYPADYTDYVPRCKICDDSGYVGSQPCHCLLTYYKAELNKQLGGLLNLSVADFDNFNLDYYSKEVDSRYDMSPYQNMEMILESCVNYVRNFEVHNDNFLFVGGTGLGKTFLSSCIAKSISEKGFFVCYDTAINIFDAFENDKFRKDSEVGQESAKYLDCDLLILDDLGTELTTNFSISALYNIINTRLIKRKHTIINTNLSMKEIKEKYSSQIISRLREYDTRLFFGTDIRYQIQNKK